MYNQLNINKFSGINLENNQTRIEENEAVEMVNMEITENGVLSKRKGFDFAFSSDQAIINMIKYKSFIVFLMADGIYRKVDSFPVQKLKACTVSYNNNNMFILNNKLYILDGTTFWEYDGETIVSVDSKAYVPTLLITCNPSNGAGAQYEQWNLLSNKYKQSFNGDGTSTKFKLALKADAYNIESILVNNVKVTSGYKLDVEIQEQGFVGEPYWYVVFTTAPSKGIDNVIIEVSITSGTTYETYNKLKERINKSSIFSFYGGQNDTRLLLGGQDSIFYRSDVYNVYYFPENYYQSVGDTEEKITGFITQYDYCVIIKEHSIWSTRFEIDSQGNPIYTTKPLNEQFGSKYGRTIQALENSPVFFDDVKGICSIAQTTIRDERNVSVISSKINKLLLNYSFSSDHYINSVDFDNKYFLAIDNKIYVYDYKNQLFYVWTTPSDKMVYYMAIIDNKLHISIGTVVIKLTTDLLRDRYYDTSTSKYIELPISCLWKSKVFSLGSETEYKKIKNLFISMQADEKASCTLKYVIDNSAINTLGTTYNYFFNYATFNYALMSYLSTTFPVTDKHKIKLKKVVYFQIEISNNAIDESLEINSISIEYKVTKTIK